MGRNTSRAMVAAVLAVVLVAGLVGSMLWMRADPVTPAVPAAPSPDPTEPAPTTPPADERAGQVMLIRQRGSSTVELCTSWGASLPPACGGPEVIGEIDWGALDATDHGGVRWVDSAWVVGHFDDARETFTLSAPPTLEPPAGVTPTTPPEIPDFPPLCEDPRRGATEDGATDEMALNAALTDLPGYVIAYVSDGRNFFNVIVQGDPEVAHAQLREVWQGDLCVVQRDLPTAADRSAAAEAVFADPELQGFLISGGAGGVEGTVDFQLLVADEYTVARIHDLTSPFVDPDDVRITEAFQPVS
ncbi:MAG: hypothetical protein GX596_12650 [Propionibacterium sp.]|nr:hypothetical protein [Propionibacterium sp.]